MKITDLVSNFVTYVKQAWENSPSVATPISADRLLHIEDGIAQNDEAVEAIASAVVDDIVDDSTKIASMAALSKLNNEMGSTQKNQLLLKGFQVGLADMSWSSNRGSFSVDTSGLGSILGAVTQIESVSGYEYIPRIESEVTSSVTTITGHVYSVTDGHVPTYGRLKLYVFYQES